MLVTGSNITTVGHYKDAAERHLNICTLLFKQLDYPQNFKHANKYQNILAELYYLSGYIVECAVNYKYFVCKGFGDNEDYYQRARWDTGVHIRGHFRFTNNRPSCEQILQQLPSSDLPDYLKNLGNVLTTTLKGQDLVREKMQQHWDPSVRYAYENTGLRFSPASTDEIKIYYKAAKDLFNALT